MSGLPALGPGQVRIWRARLDPPAAVADALVALCDTAEHAGLTRVPSPGVRRDRLVARGVLRIVLGAVLGVPPTDVAVLRPRAGPPRLAAPDGAAAALRFSLSHAGRLLTVAVGRVAGPSTGAAGIGVDVERRDAVTDVAAVARRVLTPGERRCLDRAGGGAAAFAGIWTRKEAYLKAVGTGWTTTPDRLPDLSRAGTSGTVRVHDVPVGSDYAAAVALAPATAWHAPVVTDLDVGGLLARSGPPARLHPHVPTLTRRQETP